MTNESAPKNIESAENKVEKLGKEFDLKIGGETVDLYVKGLTEILESEDELNELDIDSAGEYVKALNMAKREREGLLKKVNDNPNTTFKFSGNVLVDKDSLEEIVAKIDEVFNLYREVTKGEEEGGQAEAPEQEATVVEEATIHPETLIAEGGFVEPAETEEEKAAREALLSQKKEEESEKEGEKEVTYESVAKEIKEYAEILDKSEGFPTDIDDHMREEIQRFVSEHILTAQNIKKGHSNDKKSSIYRAANKDLKALEELNAKLNKEDRKNTGKTESIENSDALSRYDEVMLDIVNKKEGAAGYFLKHHKNLTGELQDIINEKKVAGEDAKKIDVYVSKHQEIINKTIELIRVHGFKGIGAQLLETLTYDVNRLNEFKSTFVKPEVKKEKDPAPVPTPKPKVESKKQAEYPEPLSDFDSFILEITHNEDEEAKEYFINNRRKVTGGLVRAIKAASKDLGRRELDQYISDHQKHITDLMWKITDGGKKKDDVDFVNMLQRDVDQLETFKSTSPVHKDVIRFETRDLVKEFSRDLSGEEISKLSINKNLFTRLEQAQNAYNKAVETSLADDVIRERKQRIEDLIAEMHEYFEHTPAPEKGKDKKKKAEEAAETPKPEEASETKENDMFDFDMREDFDYSEIGNDTKFDLWLKTINRESKKVGHIPEKIDLRDWYNEYQEALPYIEKVREVQRDIETNNNDAIKVLAAGEKIDNLIFKLLTNKLNTQASVDKIYDAYKESQKKKEKLESLKKNSELIEAIKKSRISNPKKRRDLTQNEIKVLLESRGGEHIDENLNEIVNYLQDFKYNFDFYNSSTESETDPDNILHAYKKFEAANAGGSEPKRLGWFGKLASRISAVMPTSIDRDDLNKFDAMIRSARKLNLVDRVRMTPQKAKENKDRMYELVDFINVEHDLITKYLTDKESIKSMSISDTDRKNLEMVEEIYKSYTVEKHTTSDARNDAEGLLRESAEEYMDDSVPTVELLYGNNIPEMALFETRAKYQVTKDSLARLENRINAIPKAVKDTREVAQIIAEYGDIEKTLVSMGVSGEDKLKLDTVTIKVYELALRNINKDNLTSLSSAFAIYDKILESNEKTVEEKRSYANELIKALEKHKGNKGNTIVQTAQLDGIIKKYQTVLKSIK